MGSQTWLLFIFLILISLSVFVTSQQTHHCFEKGNYTRGSTYSTNLNTLLSSLSSNIDDGGFYNASRGLTPDRAYAIALCRGDVQLDFCRSCVQNATAELPNICPTRKQAILWKEFCMLRYSNESFFGSRADRPPTMLMNVVNVTSPDQFNENLRTLVDNLRFQAAAGGTMIKVAAGNTKAPDFQTIFAMLQCTPDISADDCTGCLMAAAQMIPRCCPNARGVRILLPSCNLRYESAPFYNITRIQEAQLMLSAPAPVPAPAPPVPSPPGNANTNTTRTVLIIAVPIIFCLILAACSGVWLRRRIKTKLEETLAPNDEISTAESLQYDFNKVREATNYFSDANKLGEGGFGAVYKGRLQNGQEIAVKRLSRGSGQGDLEFRNEVLLVAKLQHRNLVRLFGFALEATERVLVYEFVQNASLDHYIFDPRKRHFINWDTRHKIIKGIARGLLYLHEDSRLRIIHRDLKAGNVLLDSNMNPKIADFGLARLFGQDESEGSTSRIVGTYGYMAPEYVMHGQLSVKSDVFSFGVLLLEIIYGQKNNNFRNGGSVQEDMLSFAWRNWHEGTITDMIDPKLRSTQGSFQEIIRCVHIGLLCVQENASDRPAMATVVLMLSSYTITLPMPSQPAFFMSHTSELDSSRLPKFDSGDVESGRSLNIKFVQPTHISQNDSPITELYPR